MNTTLITSDLHFSDKSRDSYRWSFVDWFSKLIKSEKPKTVLVLGDLTEEKDNHSAELVNEVSHAIWSWADLCDELIMLRGNHDGVNVDLPFFSFLSQHPRVRWITKPIQLQGRLFLPHTRNYKKDWSGLPSDSEMIFTHNTFEGADAGNGVRLSGIPVKALPKSKSRTAVSGDIHKPQSVGTSSSNVVYVGSPYAVDFGDVTESRVLSIDKRCKIGTHPYTGPQKRLFIVDLSEQNFESLKVLEGDVVKVRVSMSRKEYAESGSKTIRRIERWAIASNVNLHGVQVVFDGDNRAVAVAPERRQSSDSKVVSSFARKKRAMNMVKTGLRIVSEV